MTLVFPERLGRASTTAGHLDAAVRLCVSDETPPLPVLVFSDVPDRRAHIVRLLRPLDRVHVLAHPRDAGAWHHVARVLIADTIATDVGALGTWLAESTPRPQVVVLVAAASAASLHAALLTGARVPCVASVAATWQDVLPLATSALRHADDRMCASWIAERVRRQVPDALAPFITYCADRAGSHARLANAVEQTGLPRRTLDNQLRRAHLPTAERILGWCRVLHAAWRLDRSSDSVEHAAIDLGHASASALRNYYRRYAALSPTEARARGGFSFLLERFMMELP